ncbi:peptidoglycan bridge formation glycyltransferase FemA/FemB family protein [Staphylococcus aureus]
MKHIFNLGIKNNNNEVIAACLLTAVPVMKKCSSIYQIGIVHNDYENQELVRLFLNELFSKYIKKHRCLYLHIDPYLPYQYLNHDGEITVMLVMIGSLFDE